MRSKRVLSCSAWGGVGSGGSVEADGSTVVLKGASGLKKTPRVRIFFSAARGQPTYYVIRH